MKRICCFCERWESGGIESFLNNVLLHGDLTGIEVDLVAACVKESVFTAGLRARGVRFVPLSGKLRSLRNYRLFRKLLRSRQYDVVHFNLFQGLSLSYVQIARQEKISVRIVHSHGAGLRKSATRRLKLMAHDIGKLVWGNAATDFWACSRSAAEFLFPPSVVNYNAFHLIPNGIDTSAFRFSDRDRAQARAELGLDGQTVIGTVGRMSSEKNQVFLLDVFEEYCKLRPDSRLLLVGDGVERTDLEQKTREKGLEDRVIFYGTSYSVSRLLSAMDYFVLPSQSEGFGIAAVEAQTAGLPVLCSQGVPTEARITPWVKSMALCEGARRWAEVLNGWQPEHSRCAGEEAVRGGGYDIFDTYQLVIKKYLEQKNG